MTANDPMTFPRRILLATVGLAPQIVTETLYALCLDKAAPFVPTEIHIITTAEGEASTRRMLLEEPQAHLAKFAAEYEFPQLGSALTPDRIYVVKGVAGQPLPDISNEAGNSAAADLIIQTMLELTNDKHSALHVSIAGGRKTMGFLLGTAAQLFGRPQDRLSHVLVQPQPLEQHPEFFYPPKQARRLHNRRDPDAPIDTSDARIELAYIPFVRLRDGLPRPLLDGAWSYSETVARAQAAVAAPELVLDPSNQQVSCHGITFRLSPMQFAMYAVVIRHRLASPESDGFVHWKQIGGDDFIAEFKKLPDTTIGEINALQKDFQNIGKPGYDNDDDPRASKFQQAKKRLNDRLAEKLGPYSGPYELKTRKAPNSQWLTGIDLPASAIRFATINVRIGQGATE